MTGLLHCSFATNVDAMNHALAERAGARNKQLRRIAWNRADYLCHIRQIEILESATVRAVLDLDNDDEIVLAAFAQACYESSISEPAQRGNGKGRIDKAPRIRSTQVDQIDPPFAFFVNGFGQQVPFGIEGDGRNPTCLPKLLNRYRWLFG